MALVMPVEICDMIVDHVATLVDEQDYSFRDLFPHALERDTCSCLISLRLVSRNFCASASRHVFKHIIASLSSSRGDRNLLQRVAEISESKCAANVRHLEIGHDRWGSNSCSSLGQDIQDLAGLLSPSSCQLSTRDHEEPAITRDHERTAIEAVVAALRYVNLPCLEGLELFFPLAHDFGGLFPIHSTPLHIPMKDLLHGLKFLSSHLTAYTKELGQRYWKTDVLPTHAALPNDLHAAHLLRLVELAPHLEALSISSTDLLSFYAIHFSPALHLTSLCLSRVLITFDHFRALIEQCKYNLKHIELSLVQLHSGTWHAVLTQFRQLPHLIDFSINSCGYPATGPNAHLADVPPEPDAPEPLETMSSADYDGLGELKEFFNMNRTALGLDLFDRTDFRWSR
ncbi:protease inhibitor [Aspergillus aculeatinus CBS 121060]|uniref:Protease inhibitor n=1 Tax=Aspergillus aculeatinus CBS 121060 TaxID=1448322 RepID=A0ACD1H2X8_9EURO|nr:protease inhibitor [Aspergillus aculeatinus CBS 121060]RAH67965.1 protease inhibitor [Aspergillus aculeatinus CBS 121060]